MKYYNDFDTDFYRVIHLNLKAQGEHVGSPMRKEIDTECMAIYQKLQTACKLADKWNDREQALGRYRGGRLEAPESEKAGMVDHHLTAIRNQAISAAANAKKEATK